VSNILSLIKNNTITLVSALVVVLCVGFLVYLTLQGSAFKEELLEREAAINTISQLYRTRVRIPPEEADGRPRSLSIVVNTTAIDKLDQAYKRMDKEYREIFDLAVQLNQHNHLPMLDGLFPSTNDGALPFEAQDKYLESFEDMLGEHSSNALLPRLDAGEPPSKEVLDREFQEATNEFLRTGVGPRSKTPSVDDLSEAEREQLENRRRDAVLGVLTSRAEDIHIYAQTSRSDQFFPFDIGGWASQTAFPDMWQIWEGQRGLWVQQDIAEAIARANRTSDNKTNVMIAPVKRLISIDVAPGYVGIHHNGLLTGGNIPDDATTTVLSKPESLSLGSPDQPLPDNFAVAPSGRRSNAIYDVVHTRVVVHADYQRLSELFNSLARVNLMTVLRVEVTQLDEYEMLQEGYVYGSGDVVEAELIIESIWLRDWIEPLMPPRVKQYMGIATNNAN